MPISQWAHSLLNSLCSREKIDLKQNKSTTLLIVKDTRVAVIQGKKALLTGAFLYVSGGEIFFLG